MPSTSRRACDKCKGLYDVQVQDDGRRPDFFPCLTVDDAGTGLEHSEYHLCPACMPIVKGLVARNMNAEILMIVGPGRPQGPGKSWHAGMQPA